MTEHVLGAQALHVEEPAVDQEVAAVGVAQEDADRRPLEDLAQQVGRVAPSLLPGSIGIVTAVLLMT